MTQQSVPAWHADARLPTDQPFTYQQALRLGVAQNVLARLVREGALRRVFRGVYIDASAPDTIEQRTRALRLAVPDSAVVTDETAAWLYGVDLYPPSKFATSMPSLSLSRLPDHTRVRRPEVMGGRRMLEDIDLRKFGDVVATTPLRTACDLGRSLPRVQALAALDALLRLGDFDRDRLLGEIERFRRRRGVVQLRLLAPIADGRAESVKESALRLLWLDAGLPTPELQIPIKDAWGREVFRLDLGDSKIKYAAEFDGEEWHSTPEQIARDTWRRAIIKEDGWTIDVFDNSDLYAWSSRERLRRGYERARQRTERCRNGEVNDQSPSPPEGRGVIYIPTRREY